MVLEKTFFGKSENTVIVSKEELFIMFSVFQSRPIHYASFLLASLNTIANSARGCIHVGGIVTSIVLAIGLHNQVTHLNPLRELILIDVNHCLSRQFVRVRRPNKFELMMFSFSLSIPSAFTKTLRPMFRLSEGRIYFPLSNF